MHEEGDKFRPIWDGRYLNEFIKLPNCKYETLRNLQYMVEPGVRAIQFDLKSGYHAVSLAKEVREYFCFQVQDKFYCFNVLPFGLNIAPLVFIMLTKHLIKLLRTK